MRKKDQFVAITGIGMFSPLGITTAECWGNMLDGKSGIRKITQFDAGGCLTQIAGELPDQYFEMEKEALPRRILKRSILPSRLAILSAKQAIEDGGLDVEALDGSYAGVISGCGGSTFGDQTVFKVVKAKTFTFSHDMLNALSPESSRLPKKLLLSF